MADTKISALASGSPAQASDEYVVARSGANYKLTLTNIAASMPSTTINGALVVNEAGGNNDTRIEGDTDANLFFADASTDRIGVGTNAPSEKLDLASGNLIFSSTGQRIYGNFSGAWADRTLLQNKTANAETRVSAIPNGTSSVSGFSMSNNSSPNNSATASFRITDTAVSINSVSEGSGTPLPLQFNMTATAGGSTTTAAVIDIDGKVGIGTTTPAQKLDLGTGNFAFSGTGQRILGTFSGTLNDRTAFQSIATNQDTRMPIIPNGTATTASVIVCNNSTPSSGKAGTFRIDADSTGINSVSFSDTSDALPITFQLTPTGSADVTTERMRIAVDGKVGINTTSPGSTLDVKGTLRLSGSSSGYVGLAPAAAAGSTTYTLPSADGSNGNVLSTNGSGTLSWVAAGGTGTVTSVSGTGTVSGLTLTGTVTSSGSLTLGGTLSVNLASDVTGTLPVANGGTGITSFGTGVATWLGTPSSANLAAAVTDETGTGALVFANTPTLVTPVLGTPTSGNLSNCTADGTNAVGYRNIPQSGSDKTTSYSLVTGDVGKFIGVGSGGSITIPDATFAAGDVVSIFNNTSGNVTITCTITTAYIAGTDADKATVTLATRGVATILFLSGTVCVINGNVS